MISYVNGILIYPHGNVKSVNTIMYDGGVSEHMPMCLKKEIRDWTLYRIEVEHE